MDISEATKAYSTSGKSTTCLLPKQKVIFQEIKISTSLQPVIPLLHLIKVIDVRKQITFVNRSLIFIHLTNRLYSKLDVHQIKTVIH